MTVAAERRWKHRGAAGRSDGTASPAPLPMLPPDVMGCIARAKLAAEGGDVQAWVRLSLVNRTWRDSLRGASSSATLLASSPYAANLHPTKSTTTMGAKQQGKFIRKEGDGTTSVSRVRKKPGGLAGEYPL